MLVPASDPDFITLEYIPTSLKIKLKERLQLSNFSIKNIDVQTNKIISYLESDCPDESWKYFQEEVKKRDSYRKQDFSQTFKEYYIFLKNYNLNF